MPFLGKIPLDPRVVETGDSGKPLFLEDRDSATAKAFGDIVEEFEKVLNEKGGE